LDDVSLQKTSFAAALQAGRVVVVGQVSKLQELLGMIDTFPGMFPLIEPRPTP
jgi:alkyl sulfatase BDS1-like metallo-beta-lactamase superfamily hydrolase